MTNGHRPPSTVHRPQRKLVVYGVTVDARFLPHARGLSLTELLIVLIVLILVGAALVLSVEVSSQAVRSQDAWLTVQADARRALDAMTGELRQGRVVAWSATQLNLQRALGVGAPCAPQTVCWGATDQNGVKQANWRIRYRLDGSQVRRELLNAADTLQPGTRILANDVTQLTFSHNPAPANVVTVQLQARESGQYLPGGSMAASASPLVVQIKLRN